MLVVVFLQSKKRLRRGGCAEVGSCDGGVAHSRYLVPFICLGCAGLGKLTQRQGTFGSPYGTSERVHVRAYAIYRGFCTLIDSWVFVALSYLLSSFCVGERCHEEHPVFSVQAKCC